MVLAGEKKKIEKNRGKGEKIGKSTLSHVLEGRGWVAERSGLRLWLQLRSSSQGCRWFFKKKKNHPPMEQYITRTGTTQCPTVQTHMPWWMQEDPAFNEPVARTVHIPWLVDSYDTTRANVGWILIPKPQGLHALLHCWLWLVT